MAFACPSGQCLPRIMAVPRLPWGQYSADQLDVIASEPCPMWRICGTVILFKWEQSWFFVPAKALQARPGGFTLERTRETSPAEGSGSILLLAARQHGNPGSKASKSF